MVKNYNINNLINNKYYYAVYLFALPQQPTAENGYLRLIENK